MNILHINAKQELDVNYTNEVIADFLFEHLDEYGDKKEDIHKCLAYVFNPEKGGDIFLCLENKIIVAALVINHTGMEGYIPENILVYIAVHQKNRGKGIGKLLMREAIKSVRGAIALHVEHDNPAVYLYKKLGFTNKYLEMRLNNQVLANK
jgi:[ribosomal protein S18]-alanine N-acetyltransferase